MPGSLLQVTGSVTRATGAPSNETLGEPCAIAPVTEPVWPMPLATAAPTKPPTAPETNPTTNGPAAAMATAAAPPVATIAAAAAAIATPTAIPASRPVSAPMKAFSWTILCPTRAGALPGFATAGSPILSSTHVTGRSAPSASASAPPSIAPPSGAITRPAKHWNVPAAHALVPAAVTCAALIASPMLDTVCTASALLPRCASAASFCWLSDGALLCTSPMRSSSLPSDRKNGVASRHHEAGSCAPR